MKPHQEGRARARRRHRSSGHYRHGTAAEEAAQRSAARAAVSLPLRVLSGSTALGAAAGSELPKADTKRATGAAL